MRYNIARIRTKKPYLIEDICTLFDIDRKTVSRWLKEGLLLVENRRKPYYIMGYDLKAFIKAKREAKKVRLAPNELYCVSCKKAVLPKRGTRSIKKTGKKTGANNRDQKAIHAHCRDCNNKIRRLI